VHIPRLTSGNLLQLGQVPIEDIGISAIGIAIGVLPDGLERPATGDGPGSAAVAGQDQRALGGERGGVPRALGPPVGGAVDQWVAGGLGVVGVHEVADPGDHGGLAQAVAGGPRRVVLDVQHAREGDAVAGPASTMGEEVVGLGCAAAGVRVGKVVTATDEAGVRRPGVVGREGRVNVGGAFGGLGGGGELAVRPRQSRVADKRGGEAGQEISP
jgi:hypothetical protein